MPTTIIDLDDILGADKKVRLAGKTYVLPPDLPVELYLRINRFAQTDATDVEMIQSLHDEVLGLFRYKAPDLEELPMSMSQLVGAIGRIYGAAEEPEAAPPRPAGGRSSSKPKTTRSRR